MPKDIDSKRSEFKAAYQEGTYARHTSMQDTSGRIRLRSNLNKKYKQRKGLMESYLRELDANIKTKSAELKSNERNNETRIELERLKAERRVIHDRMSHMKKDKVLKGASAGAIKLALAPFALAIPVAGPLIATGLIVYGLGQMVNAAVQRIRRNWGLPRGYNKLLGQINQANKEASESKKAEKEIEKDLDKLLEKTFGSVAAGKTAMRILDQLEKGIIEAEKKFSNNPTPENQSKIDSARNKLKEALDGEDPRVKFKEGMNKSGEQRYAQIKSQQGKLEMQRAKTEVMQQKADILQKRAELKVERASLESQKGFFKRPKPYKRALIESRLKRLEQASMELKSDLARIENSRTEVQRITSFAESSQKNKSGQNWQQRLRTEANVLQQKESELKVVNDVVNRNPDIRAFRQAQSALDDVNRRLETDPTNTILLAQQADAKGLFDTYKEILDRGPGANMLARQERCENAAEAQRQKVLGYVDMTRTRVRETAINIVRSAVPTMDPNFNRSLDVRAPKADAGKGESKSPHQIRDEVGGVARKLGSKEDRVRAVSRDGAARMLEATTARAKAIGNNTNLDYEAEAPRANNAGGGSRR